MIISQASPKPRTRKSPLSESTLAKPTSPSGSKKPSSPIVSQASPKPLTRKSLLSESTLAKPASPSSSKKSSSSIEPSKPSKTAQSTLQLPVSAEKG